MRICPGSRLVAEPGRDVRDAADGRVVGPPLEPDPAERRVALGDPDAEAEIVPAPAPLLLQLRDARAHRDRHPHGALRRVVARDRIVEEHHQPIAGESLERALEPVDQVAERGVVLAQDLP